MKYKIAIITCIGLFILLYIIPLGVRPMVIPDEFRYAEIPREMLETGDWAVPHLDSLRYFEKPVFGYWLNATGIAMFGENAFAIRFFSAVAAGISAVILFFLARKYADGYRTGILVATSKRDIQDFVDTFCNGDSGSSAMVPDGLRPGEGLLALFFLDRTYPSACVRQRWTAPSAVLVFHSLSFRGRISLDIPVAGCDLRPEKHAFQRPSLPLCYMLVSAALPVTLHFARQTHYLYPAVLSAPCRYHGCGSAAIFCRGKEEGIHGCR